MQSQLLLFQWLIASSSEFVEDFSPPSDTTEQPVENFSQLSHQTEV